MFNEVLRFRGVQVFGSSVALIQRLRSMGRRIAIVTSSKNCDAVLEAAGIQDLFDARVDGNVSTEKKLAGKPAPETYEEAARMLGVPPERAVVIEDAISGVQAGRAGGFGLVIGVARGDDPEVLRESGADIVVRDLVELSLG
jgi:alpha,alpha-trehalase